MPRREHVTGSSRIGAALRTARQQAGITVAQLAALTDVSPAHIRNIQTGRRRLTPELAQKIARELGTTPDALLAPATGDDE